MRNIKLMKLSEFEYGFFINGHLIKKGPITLLKMFMENRGITDIDLALKVMKDNNDDVADFGINGGFIISLKFEDANMGFPTIKEA